MSFCSLMSKACWKEHACKDLFTYACLVNKHEKSSLYSAGQLSTPCLTLEVNFLINCNEISRQFV